MQYGGRRTMSLTYRLLNSFSLALKRWKFFFFWVYLEEYLTQQRVSQKWLIRLRFIAFKQAEKDMWPTTILYVPPLINVLEVLLKKSSKKTISLMNCLKKTFSDFYFHLFSKHLVTKERFRWRFSGGLGRSSKEVRTFSCQILRPTD